MREGNSKIVFDTLKMRSTTQQGRTCWTRMAPFLPMRQVLRRWTEYCQELYNYKLRPDTRFLDNIPNTNGRRDVPILQTQVEEAHTS